MKRALPLLKSAPGAELCEPRAVDREVRPIYAVWEVTLRCDLACRHCGSRAGHARPNELSTAECLRLVGELAALGVKEVTLIGGEAYLRPDWTKLIRAIRRAGMLPSITTGGRNLTPERARAAARAGLQTASVSVDGSAAIQDELRGVKGAFAAALAALAHLRGAGIPISANTQVNRRNRAELPALAETLIGAGIQAWQIMLTVPMGRAADRPEWLLQPYDLLELVPELARVAERVRRAGVRLWTGNNVGYFGPHEAVLRADLPCDHSAGCGAAHGTIGIEADGTIKGCPSLQTDTWAAGNVREHSLLEIWERGKALQALRSRSRDELWGFCKSCYYAPVCGAGCTWTADAALGRPGNNPYCHHRALELAAGGQRERLVPVAAAPGLPFDRARFELVSEPLSP
jgi:radical SAM protein with 4Fe4S-binding SPASM domain